MSLIRKAAEWTVEFGGEEHTGWLPKGASTPAPTPLRRVDLALAIIEQGPESYLLEWRGPTEDTTGDTWHSSLAGAIAAAVRDFGIPEDAWADVPDPRD